MANYKAALLELEKFHRAFKAFEEIKETITATASLEQSVDELHQKRKQYIAALDKEIGQLETFRKDSKEEQEKVIANSKENIEKLKDRYIKIEEQLRDNAEKVKLEYASKVGEYESKIAEQELILRRLNINIKDKEEEYSILEGKLVTVRKQIENILNK